jgi:hypothetical protein
MKAIFEFELPEEIEEFTIFRQARDYRSVLCEIDNYCRSKIKHHEISEEVEAELKKIRQMIGEVEI